jgi:hypothetical protein
LGTRGAAVGGGWEVRASGAIGKTFLE